LFVFEKQIGDGKFGTVFLARPKSDPDAKVAIKLIPQKSFSNRIEKELELLSTIEHQNIIKYFAAYKDKTFYYIVTEYCEGGELFKKIIDQGGLDELEA
jgi:calcium-dependent protein kinase